MVLSNCPVCGSKKSRFIKEPGVSGILSTLKLRKTLSKIPVVGTNCFRDMKKFIQNMK